MNNETEVIETTQKKSLLNKVVKIVLPILIGGLILYFLFRDTDFNQLGNVLKEANWAILLLSLPFGLLGNTIRAYRWELLIKPLGYSPRISTLAYAIYGGYAVNFAIPRGGEIWRCGIVAKEEKIPFVKLIGTVILDRILDTLMLLFIVLFAFFFNMQFFISYLQSNEEILDKVLAVLSSPILYTIIFLCLVCFAVTLKFFRENFIVRKALDIALGFWKDIKAMWKMKQKARLVVYSFAIWFSYFLYFYITFYAFGFTKDLGLTAGLIAFAISSLSMMIPTNGGVGAWHAAVIAALMLYSIDKVSAEAFAVGVFGIQMLWLLVCGLYGMLAISFRKQRL